MMMRMRDSGPRIAIDTRVLRVFPTLGRSKAIHDGMRVVGAESGRELMAPYFDRAMLIEDLQRATQELAMSPPSITEAAALRARLVALLETLGERAVTRRSAPNGLQADS